MWGCNRLDLSITKYAKILTDFSHTAHLLVAKCMEIVILFRFLLNVINVKNVRSQSDSANLL